MKLPVFLWFLFLVTVAPIAFSQGNKAPMSEDNTALLIIDIQYFYFPGGSLPLVEPENASKNASEILKEFREKGMLVIHVKHNAKKGTEIYPDVAPVEGEKVITKNEANAFLGTDLLEFLNEKNIKNLIITGMQTQMCVEAATRAAHDYGFKCTVVDDACATRDLRYKDKIIKSWDVHYATLSALSGSYAKIVSTTEILQVLEEL